MRVLIRSAVTAAFLLCLRIAPAVADATPADPGAAPQCPRRPVPLTSLAMSASDYPLLSVMENEQGNVVLDFQITADGAVTDMKIASSSGFARLDGAAADTAKQRWRYNPVLVDGKPISCRWKIRVVWLLEWTPEQLAEGGPFTIVRMGPSDYPTDILARREEGVTAIWALVDENGKVSQADIAQRSRYPDLDSASVDLVKKRGWRIAPPRLGGKPIRMVTGFVIVWSMSPSQAATH